MSPNGAYPDEMDAVVPTRPDPEVRTLLVPRLAEVARVATLEAETHARDRATPDRVSPQPRSRRALVARVAVAVALVPLALAGLAFARVAVPAPARDAFESVGITLPNQPSDHSRKAPATTKPNPSGSEGGGNDVSNAAQTPATGKGGNSGAAHEHARNQHEKAHGEAKGHGRGKATWLNESSPPRHSGHTGPAPSNAGRASGSHSSSKAAPHTPHTPKGAAAQSSKSA